jgi:hypothetical protein
MTRARTIGERCLGLGRGRSGSRGSVVLGGIATDILRLTTRRTLAFSSLSSIVVSHLARVYQESVNVAPEDRDG